jgi:hypothetical protein
VFYRLGRELVIGGGGDAGGVCFVFLEEPCSMAAGRCPSGGLSRPLKLISTMPTP